MKKVKLKIEIKTNEYEMEEIISFLKDHDYKIIKDKK